MQWIICLSLIAMILTDAEAYIPPSHAYIGGLFHVIDPHYNKSTQTIQTFQDLYGSYHLAAFLLAIDQVNNKTDGILDSILPNTTLQVAVDINDRTASNSLLVPNNDYYDGGQAAYTVRSNVLANVSGDLLGVVIALNDDATIGSLGVLNTWAISSIVTNSSSSRISSYEDYMYKNRLTPCDEASAVAIYRLIKYFDWNRIAVIYTSDTLGINTMKLFQYISRNDDRLLYLEKVYYSPNTVDLSAVISQIKDSGATIILLFMNDYNTAYFLYQAYITHLLQPHIQVVGISLQSTQSLDTFDSWKVSQETRSAIMLGYISIKPAYLYSYDQTNYITAFLNSFTRLEPTVSDNGSVCETRRDDTSASDAYLYEDSLNHQCMGISSFKNFSLDSYPNVLYTYRSVFIYGIIIDYLIAHNIDVSSSNVHDLISNPILSSILLPYSSVIGNVSFFQGLQSENHLDQGESLIGHSYRIVNYQNESIVSIGVYDPINGIQHCSEISYSFDCYDIHYRNPDLTRSNDVPSDMQPDRYEEMSDTIIAVFLFFAILIFIISLFSILFYFYYRDTKTITNSQLKITILIITAQILGGVRVLLEAMPVTTSACTAKLWLIHISFRLMYGTYMLKLWRIHRIINTSGIQRVKITENDVLLYVEVHFFAVLIALGLITGLSDMQVDYYSTISSNQSILQPICRLHASIGGNIIVAALYASECVYLLVGNYYLFLTRSVPPVVNETKPLTLILLGSFITILICFFLIQFGGYNPVDVSIIVTSGCIVVVMLSMITYMIHKINRLRIELNAKKSNRGNLITSPETIANAASSPGNMGLRRSPTGIVQEAFSSSKGSKSSSNLRESYMLIGKLHLTFYISTYFVVSMPSKALVYTSI